MERMKKCDNSNCQNKFWPKPIKLKFCSAKCLWESRRDKHSITYCKWCSNYIKGMTHKKNKSFHKLGFCSAVCKRFFEHPEEYKMMAAELRA